MVHPAAPPASAVGVDLGSRHVGLAVADPTGTIASPFMTLERTRPTFWAQLEAACAERGASLLVVGLPRQMDGSEGSAAAAAREFAVQAGRRLHLPVELWDERLTTVAAERALIQTGMRRARRRRTIDAVAAALMLQSWLDSRRPGLIG